MSEPRKCEAMLNCGELCDASCDLPGIGFPRCRNKCERKPRHVGRCWCKFHEANPTSVITEDDVPPQEESFKGVLNVLKEKGLIKHGVKLFKEGVATPSELARKPVETLISWGIPDEDAVELVVKGAKRKAREDLREQGKDRREDHPAINPRTRGSKMVARKELATEEGKERWRSILMKDVYANSTMGPREAIWQTWKEAAE